MFMFSNWISGVTASNNSLFRQGTQVANIIAGKLIAKQALIGVLRPGYDMKMFSNTDILTIQRVVADRPTEAVKFTKLTKQKYSGIVDPYVNQYGSSDPTLKMTNPIVK